MAAAASDGPSKRSARAVTGRKYIGDSDSDDDEGEEDEKVFKSIGAVHVYGGDDIVWNLHELLYKLKAKDSSDTQAIYGYRLLKGKWDKEQRVRVMASLVPKQFSCVRAVYS